ncbi:MAG: very short patch repair endonuclease [Chlamydiota bacterium]
MDKYTVSVRSRIMAAVKPRGNKSTELQMVGLLRRHGFVGWRRHYPVLGTPDFCWPSKKTAMFVDGCFWHGCPRFDRKPRSNIAFWKAKIERNRQHDRRITSTLKRLGWTVLRIWECQVNSARTLSRLKSTIPTGRHRSRRLR